MNGIVLPPRINTVNKMSISVVVKISGLSIGFSMLSAKAMAIAPRSPIITQCKVAFVLRKYWLFFLIIYFLRRVTLNGNNRY